MTVIDHKGLSFGNFQFPNGAETGNGHLTAALRGHYKKAAGIPVLTPKREKITFCMKEGNHQTMRKDPAPHRPAARKAARYALTKQADWGTLTVP